ncbi:hypothetical protein BS47DRAFT_1387897 [Hydnum rufescens UP504]|uniref:Uncharacterized protein n=1 Tax=Hydnum rufescens UP504 TaxID=1448309 RepID=A0A9P6B8C7_9AGAM|nr:hypothetical protein BS47DRAFT_1387897 [Hydnum rufescens UP504]
MILSNGQEGRSAVVTRSIQLGELAGGKADIPSFIDNGPSMIELFIKAPNKSWNGRWAVLVLESDWFLGTRNIPPGPIYEYNPRCSLRRRSIALVLKNHDKSPTGKASAVTGAGYALQLID